MVDYDDLKYLIDIAKEANLKSLKVGDVEIVLNPAPPEQVVLDPAVLNDPINRQMTEEDILHWSVGGSPHITSDGKQIGMPLVGEQDGD